MKILIVGGTGCISTAVTNLAVSRDIDVSMINRGVNIKLIPNSVNLIKSDKNNKSYIRERIGSSRFDAVIDFLCYTKNELIESFEFYKNFTKQYVFISSSAVYDYKSVKICKEDSAKITTGWQYGLNKLECENALIELCNNSSINYTIIRPGVTYGNTRLPYGITPPYGYHGTIIQRIRHKKPIITWNNGQNKCNITHVDDFAVGFLGLIGNKQAFNTEFNIVGDECPSWSDVLNAISSVLNEEIIVSDLPLIYYASKLKNRSQELLHGRAIDYIISNKKLKRIVPEFKQTIFLKQGVQSTINNYLENNNLKGFDYNFDGDTDRIINHFQKRKISNFIDYENTATQLDKIMYFLSYYDLTLLRRVLNRLILKKKIK